MFIPPSEITGFFEMLNQAGLNYVLIKNISNELPGSLEDVKDIDILVHPDSKTEFEKVMENNGYERVIPPLGVENGWVFGYGVPSYQFWLKTQKPFQLYIDANFVLCCKSLIPKTWVPLNKPINDSVWREKKFDAGNGWWVMDDENQLLYLLTRCVFDKKSFSPAYILEIEKRKHLLSHIREKLQITFYKYTPRLAEMIAQGRYPEIIGDYIAYDEY